MNKQDFNNAAKRDTYVGNLFQKGTTETKKEILSRIDSSFKRYHNEGYIHIHDLEGYGNTYNCLTPDILKKFPFERLEDLSNYGKIAEIFNFYKYIISNLANEQPGGIAFANFDADISYIFKKLDIEKNDESLLFLKESLKSFIYWINTSRTRYGQECYYISLNLGLSTNQIGRFVTRSILESFLNSPSNFIRPNIIFKVDDEVNLNPQSPNFDLYNLAIECTAKKMIPTYLLCSSKPNVNFQPDKLAVMGCRTRVMQNLHGEETSIGRGNIAYITVNLPRIALEVMNTYEQNDINKNIKLLKAKWDEVVEISRSILLDRLYSLDNIKSDYFPTNTRYDLWNRDFNSSENFIEVFKQGTLSIGFIGLSEAFEIMSGEKYYTSEKNYSLALELVKYMRFTLDELRNKEKVNFTLLATSGEYISGRFPKIDSGYYDNEIVEKGYYTNSFHVDVDSKLHPFEKLRIEGEFHELCNGGCITYVEFASAPLNNLLSIDEIIRKSIECGVSYLGINYPLDICNDCGEKGTFDSCLKCGSQNIKRVRRVSGYLEDSSYFTEGKKAEVKNRKPNYEED